MRVFIQYLLLCCENSGFAESLEEALLLTASTCFYMTYKNEQILMLQTKINNRHVVQAAHFASVLQNFPLRYKESGNNSLPSSVTPSLVVSVSCFWK